MPKTKDILKPYVSINDTYRFFRVKFEKAHIGCQEEGLQTIFHDPCSIVGSQLFGKINRSRTFKQHSSREFRMPKAGIVKEFNWKNPAFENATLRMQFCRQNGYLFDVITDCPCGWPDENYSFFKEDRSTTD